MKKRQVRGQNVNKLRNEVKWKERCTSHTDDAPIPFYHCARKRTDCVEKQQLYQKGEISTCLALIAGYTQQ